MEACKKIIGSYEKRAAPGETPDAYADVFLPLYNVVHPYDIIFVKQVKISISMLDPKKFKLYDVSNGVWWIHTLQSVLRSR